MKTFELEVITPERTVFKETVTSAVIPTQDGSIGILADHAPLLTAVGTGAVEAKLADGRESHLMVTGGFLEVSHNHARLLAEIGERAEDIDIERALEAAKRARERLKNRAAGDVDVMRAEAALLRALIREKIARDLRGTGGSTSISMRGPGVG